MTSHHALKHEAKRSKSKIITQAKSSKSFATLGFQVKFQNYCIEAECKLIPTIEVLEELKYVKPDKEIPILIVVYKPGGQEELDKIFFKNYPLESSVILALEKCFEDMTRITVLKLEFCNMTSEQIEILANILANATFITEVSVSGNPNNDQNFHLLLKDTKLLTLSLKYCSINHIGMEKISAELSKPFECTLLHLNLSSNLLFDEGIDHVISFLRINRTLVCLNLADNKIYDEGCIKLMLPLQKFALELPEMIIRRQIRFTLFRKELEASASVTTTTSCVEINNRGSLQGAKRSSSAKLNRTGSIKGSKRSLKEKASICSQETLGSKKSSLKESKCDIGIHPFVQDSYEEDMDIYCKGNDALISISLSYNRITKEGLNSIIQMLYYQRNTYANDKVISRISLEGNDLNNDCEQELQEFDDLINNRTRKSSNISNRRSSSIRKGSRVSITHH